MFLALLRDVIMKPLVCSIERRTFFKRCTCCGKEWNSRYDFINDIDIIYIGYQAHFKKRMSGLFYFNHSCKGTMAILAEKFNNAPFGAFQIKLKEKHLLPVVC